jgi:hypothetical protein
MALAQRALLCRRWVVRYGDIHDLGGRGRVLREGGPYGTELNAVMGSEWASAGTLPYEPTFPNRRMVPSADASQ